MKIKVPTPRQLFLLLIILMLIFCTFLSVAYWFNNPHKTNSSWAVDQLNTPNRNDLQNRINSQFFADDSLDTAGDGRDLNSTVDTSAMDARLEGLTKNVTTQAVPSNQQLEDFYRQNRENYREPSKLWLELVSFSTALHGAEAIDKAQQALAKSSPPVGDSVENLQAVLSTTLEEKYGGAFADTLLLKLAENTLPCWIGPISSARGVQLVCVKKIVWGAYTPLEEIRTQLINDWRFSMAVES